MKILVFGASNSSISINKKFAVSVSKYFKELDDTKEVIDLNDYEMPIYSYDREAANGIPDLARAFAAKIDWADLIIVSFAEHNGNCTAAYKNINDWVSRIKERKIFNGTPVFVLATSNGPRGGQSALDIMSTRITRDGAEVLEAFSLPEFSKNFEEGKGIITPLLRSQLEAKVRKIKRLMAAKTL